MSTLPDTRPEEARNVPAARGLVRLRFATWAACGLLVGGAGCDASPQEATGAKGAVASQPVTVEANVVRLDSAQVERGGIEVRPAMRGDFRTFREFPGTVQPNENELADITSLVRGRVVDVYADLGQEVQSGTILALLYSSEIGIAQSAYLKAKAKLVLAERAFRRARVLLKEKVIGRAEAQRRESELIGSRAEAREARDRLLLLGMTEKEIAQLEKDEVIRSYVPIIAPFEGRVITRNLTRGEVVNTNEQLFQVADLSKVWVVANVPEKDIPFVHRDQAAHPQIVEVRVAAYPHEVFQGKITYVGDVLDPETRTMRIRLELQNPEGRLKPEMYATIRVFADPERNVLTVPEGAVLRHRNGAMVFVQLAPDAFEARPVTVGESNGVVIRILDGLQAGEPIVSRGGFILKSELLKKEL